MHNAISCNIIASSCLMFLGGCSKILWSCARLPLLQPMGRFGFLMPSAQSWRESDVELGIKRPMVSASAAAAANNLELQIMCSCNRCGTDHGPFRPKLAWQRRRCHASFGRKHVASPRPLHGVLETRQRLLTATYNLQYYRCSMAEYIMWDWNLIWRNAT